MRHIQSFIILLIIIIGSGCSATSENPLLTQIDKPILSELPSFDIQNMNSDREISGSWTMIFDPVSYAISVIENRTLDVHFNVQRYLPAPVFTVHTYDPFSGILDVDAQITNSFPVIGYDLRLIVFTDSLGSRLKNPDDWSANFDIPSGSMINPFKAYAKDEPGRIFAGNGTSHTELLQLYFPAGFSMLDFAIDVSYPDNCAEPYKISGFHQSSLGKTAASQAICEVQVYDWQDDVSDVTLWCPSITGVPSVPFAKTGNSTWSTTITNSAGAGEGSYIAAIIAKSQGHALYDVENVIVSETQDYEGFEWTQTWGGIDEDTGVCIDTDSMGNIYIAGSFRETVDFDPGDGVDEHTAVNDWDVFFSKFTPDGGHVWTKVWGGSQIDNASAIAIDDSDNIYVAGTFSVSVDLDPGPGTDIHDCVNYAHDPFLSKFDTDGNYIWGVDWGGEKNDFVYGLGFDLYDNIIITGSFWINADFDPGINEVIHTAAGRNDAFLLVLDPNGEYIISYTWGGAGEDKCNGIIGDSNDNFYVTGDFEYTVDLNPTSGTFNVTSSGSSDIFLTKFNTSGQFVSAVKWGGTGQDIASGVGIDSSDFLYIAGSFENTVDFDPGAGVQQRSSNGDSDIYLSKLNNSLTFLWVRTWGGLGSDRCFDVMTLPSGDCYVTGSFVQSVDFDTSASEWYLSSNGFDDIFMSKFTGNGDFISAMSTGGTLSDRAYCVHADESQKVYLTGSYEGLNDFNPGKPVDDHLSNGYGDVFLMSLDD